MKAAAVADLSTGAGVEGKGERRGATNVLDPHDGVKYYAFKMVTRQLL